MKKEEGNSGSETPFSFYILHSSFLISLTSYPVLAIDNCLFFLHIAVPKLFYEKNDFTHRFH